jgi:hypothetical protein
MKKTIVSLIVFIFSITLFYGCADKEYYTAQENAYKAQITYLQVMQNKPMVSFTTRENETFVVNNPNIPMPQPNIRPLQNPVVELIKSVVGSPVASILAGGWATKEIVKNSVGSINVSDGSTYSSNSNNRTASGSGYVSEDHSVDNTDNTNNSINDSYNETAEPYIVEQPPYNDPIIVTQPPYNDPIIVGE